MGWLAPAGDQGHADENGARLNPKPRTAGAAGDRGHADGGGGAEYSPASRLPSRQEARGVCIHKCEKGAT